MFKLVMLVLWAFIAAWLTTCISPGIAMAVGMYDSDSYPLIVVAGWVVLFFAPIYISKMTPDLDVEPVKKSWY